jgi:hypothetical protein
LLVSLATCGACRARKPEAPTEASAAASTAPRADGSAAAASPLESPLAAKLWQSATDGETEDLAALAAHEGARGLVDAARDPALRGTAIRAMAFARGFAQLPFLARTAAGEDDADARLALDVAIDLAARPRTWEDPEDADELRDGCDGLDGLARDVSRPRDRRVAAIRALRMMPCPPRRSGELPTDVDAR